MVRLRDIATTRLLLLLAFLLVAMPSCVLTEPAEGDSQSKEGSHTQAKDHHQAPPSRPISTPTPAKPTMSLRRILPKNLNVKVVDVDVVQQIDYGLETIPSIAAFLTINLALKYLMRQVLGITKFPHPLVGMFMAFAGLMSMKEKDAAKVVSFFKPGLDLLTNFLPAFFAPGLIVTPLAMKDVSAVDFTKFLSVLGLGGSGLYFIIANVVAILQEKGNREQKAQPQAPKRAGFKSWFSPQLEKIFFTLTGLSLFGFGHDD
ncbi:hypothetical protein GUITHDRAFT_111531 [Guillardia theta CCMP2712]|uniref:Uncharacterized protein n=1 Tax=Guillardia theta (strain CCMP2712) TaxID=905079 RepID=L1J208_GUITC|nr:hypothetical protein GUITHDRAFT_111531 [Guillardia theta CCMP2712]EKX42556.1 hypothetical protein GUITHDRAFT_111531 [Guillardia theta CCMP2712]|eukprot:XP_005829536.1 hypothetical protein GUITHDRAFT_111531 [Guillardia theta CCMP2712]